MTNLLYFCTVVGSIIGGAILFFALTMSNGAPQEASGAAIALCFAVLPYCCARGWQESNRAHHKQKENQQLADLIASAVAAELAKQRQSAQRQPPPEAELHPMVKDYFQRQKNP